MRSDGLVIGEYVVVVVVMIASAVVSLNGARVQLRGN